MITALTALAMRAGLSKRAASVVGYAALIGALVALLSVAKCAYDRGVIDEHEAKREAAIAPVIRQADASAADTRISDQKRNQADENAERAAVAPLPDARLSDRQRQRACAILQRQARERGRESPAGC
ncbi:hypothetical protein [Sphingomonas sp. SRS2]|uniref:hypothetical protein n=1 Tax=Sphingomonas sp. SRS2 TaxID=133190 RepID=UPI000618437B|nr:hypothetical protein [Sphingomonas sp. SRS2]KKC24678.1 hypothetical protein WP12_17745 [Sphingomonas sp. SRS2]